MYRSKDSDAGNSKSATETRSDATLPGAQGDVVAAGQAVQLAQATVDLTNVKQTFTSTDGATIQLPAGTTFDQIVVKDGNLFLIQPDGTVIVILNAVQFPPTLVVGDITIPSANLAQVLSQSPEGVPTAGPTAGGPESSGADLSAPPGFTGDLTPIGPLLPPTGLVFNLFPVEDFDALIDQEEDDGSPSIGLSDMVILEEDDLERDYPRTDGNDKDNSVVKFMATGNLGVSFGPDGPGSITFPASITAPEGFTSNGEQITLALVDPKHLVAFVDDGNGTYEEGVDRLVFDVVIDDTVPGGEVKVTLYDNLDHGIPSFNGLDSQTDPLSEIDEELLTLNIAFQVTDGNGTTVPGVFQTKVQDDIPVIKHPEKVTVDEDDIDTKHHYGYEQSGYFTPDEGDYQPYQSYVVEGSKGTSPEDGNHDGSYTGSPYFNNGGPATAWGDLNIKWGADDGNMEPSHKFGDDDGTEYFTSAAVDVAGDIITFGGNGHDFEDGEKVVYNTSDPKDPSTHIGGLTPGSYYVITSATNPALAPNQIQLALTPTDAANGIAIDLTSGGGGGFSPDGLLAEVEGNDSLATAQVINLSDFAAGGTPNPDVGDDSQPWVSISGTIGTNNDVDLYCIQLEAGETITLDIDFGIGGSGSVDTQLQVFDAAGNSLASNDDDFSNPGGGGSTSALDSFLTFTAGSAGTYYIGVSSFNNDALPGLPYDGNGGSSGDYVLNISLDTTRTPEPLSGEGTQFLHKMGDRSVIFDPSLDGKEPGYFSYDGYHTLTSKGEQVYYVLSDDGTKLYALAGGDSEDCDIILLRSLEQSENGCIEGCEPRLVFTVELFDTGEGSYKVKLYDQLDHPLTDNPFTHQKEIAFEDIIQLGFKFIATDSDGDMVSSLFKVNFTDDIPECVECETVYKGQGLPEGAYSSDLLFAIQPGVGLTIDITNMTTDADYENSLGYYFADANGNPISGVIIEDDIDSDPDGAETVTISGTSIPANAVMLGFFIIPDGDGLQNIQEGAEVTFQFQGGQWVAFINGVEVQTAQDAILFSDRRLNPDINNDGDTIPGDDFEVGGGQYDSNWEDKHDDSDKDFNDVQFNVHVCADVVEVATVDEDDIYNSQSHGTSPDDGNADGSYTGNPGENIGGPATVTGSLKHLVVGGADEKFTFSFTYEHQVRDYLHSLGLKSQGERLSYDVQGNVLYGFVNDGGTIGESYDPQYGDRLVFKLTVDYKGEYKFELFDQMDHDTPFDDAGDGSGLADENFDLQDSISGDVNFINFGKVVKVTDYDGDAILLDGKFIVKIRDDVPQLGSDAYPRSLTVDEDDVDTELSHGTSVDDGPGDGSYSGNTNVENGDNPSFLEGPANVSTSLAGLVESGTDEPLSFMFIDAADARAYLEALGLRSKGELISYDFDTPGIVEAFVQTGGGGTGYTSYDPGEGDRLVFRLTLTSNGNVTFELFDQTDHDHPNDNTTDGVSDTPGADENFDLQDSIIGDVSQIDFGSIIKAVDYDGDAVVLEGLFGVTIRDDIPKLLSGMVMGQVSEEGIVPYVATPGEFAYVVESDTSGSNQWEDILRIDLSTGAATFVGDLANGSGGGLNDASIDVEGAAVSPGGTILYLLANDVGTTVPDLIAYNLSTGVTTSVFSNLPGGDQSQMGLEFHPDGSLYMVIGEELYRVTFTDPEDPTTASGPTEIGSDDTPELDAFAIDPTTGLGYGIANDDDLYSVDLTTNVRTLIGDISGTSSSDNISGMSFDSAGNMWVYDRDEGVLHRIDFKTNPSNPTVVQTVSVGLTSTGDSYEELAIVPTGTTGGGVSIDVDLTPLVQVGTDENGNGGAIFALKTFDATGFGNLTSDGNPVEISSDGTTLSGVANGEVVFTLVVSEGGIATFTLFKELDHGDLDILELDFSQYVTARDFDYDTIMLGERTFIIKVEDGNEEPTLLRHTENAVVDEDGFQNANLDGTPDLRPGEVDSTENTMFTGQIVVDFNGAGEIPANLDTSIVLEDVPGLDGQLLALNGNPITFALNGGVLEGTAAGVSGPIITIEIVTPVPPAVGTVVTYEYKVTLLQPVQHPSNDDEDSDFLNGVPFKVTDANGDMVGDTFDVEVVDDIPVAKDDTACVDEGSIPTLNAILVIDLSSSMDLDADGNPGGQTRLELLQSAVNTFLASSNVIFNEIIVYTFEADGNFIGQFNGLNAASTAASTIGLFDSGDLVAATDYVDAVTFIQSHYPGLTISPADLTNLYFMSDGDPTGGVGLDGTQETAWGNFLTTNGIDTVYALGFGGIVNTNFLDPIAARDGIDQAQAITDSSMLASTLVGTLPGSVSGNVLDGTDGIPGNGDDDMIGADQPGRVLSIEIDGTVYTWDGATNVAVSGANPGADLLANTGTSITVMTDLGGILTFDFTTGDWDYQAPASVDENTDEVFPYVIQDEDGDKSGATLTITVKDVSTPIVQEGGFEGIVEEEHLDNLNALFPGDGPANIAGSSGNEDETASPDEDDDTLGDHDITTDQTTGDLSALISGVDGTPVYGFAVADGTPVNFVEGPVVTSKGLTVYFVESGGVLYGVTNEDGDPDSIDPDDRIIFQIELNTATGVFTFTLIDQIDHHPYDGFPVDDVEGILSINLSDVFNVTDDDGSHTFSDIAVKVIDDIPVIAPIADQDLSFGQALAGITEAITASVGADDDGEIRITEVSEIPGITATIAPDGQSVSAVFASGDPAYTISLNSDGTYSFQLLSPLVGATITGATVTIPPGGPQQSVATISTGGTLTFDGVKFDPFSNPDDGTDEINASSNGFGIDNNTVDTDEGFIASYSGTTATSLTFEIVFSGNTPNTLVTWQAFKNGVLVGSATDVNVLNPAGPADTVSFSIDPAGAVDFDQVIVQFENGGPTENIRVQNFTTTTVEPADGLSLDVTLTATDEDGDAVSDTFNIEVGNEPPVANADTVLTNIVDGSQIVIPTAAMTYNDTDPNGDPLNAFVDTGSGVGGTVAQGSAIFTPILAAPTIDTAEYRFTDVTTATAAAGGHRAGYFEFDNADDDALLSIGNPSGFVANLSNTDYNNIESSNNIRYTTPDPGQNDNAVFFAEFDISEDPSTITSLVLRVEARQNGSPSGDEGIDLGIYNYSTGQWEILDEQVSTSDVLFNETISANPANYVSPDGKVTLALYNEDDGNDAQQIAVDNVELDVNYQVPEPFESGSYEYFANDGFESSAAPALVSIEGQNSQTVQGTGANEILIGRSALREVTAAVQSGSTFGANANNAFSFAFLAAAFAGDSITQIQIDLTGLGVFDQGAGGGERSFELGSNSDVTPLSVTAGDTSILTITFNPGEFTAGDELLFGIDVDDSPGGFNLDNGEAFGQSNVPLTITFSDGSSISGVYEVGSGSTSVAELTQDTGSTLLGDGGNDYLVGSDGNDTIDGGAGNDVIVGGLGDDHMTGGADADTFVQTEFNINDLIADYDFAGFDEVDITALLDLPSVGGAPDLTNISQYVSYDSSADSNTGVLSVDPTGTGSFGPGSAAVTVTTDGVNAAAQVRIVVDDGAGHETTTAIA